ncbi:hypothetical protein D9M72_493000 [compost metagenome]
MKHVGARGELEHLGGKVWGGPIASGCVADLAWRRLQQSHDRLRIVRLHPGIEDHHRRRRPDHADRHEVLDRVVAQALQCRIHRMSGDVSKQERITVGRGSHDELAGNCAVGACLVVHHNGLLEN